jgi:hypothetical protein
VLVTSEFSPLEPQTEQKFYARGVGEIAEHVVKGHREAFRLVSVATDERRPQCRTSTTIRVGALRRKTRKPVLRRRPRPNETTPSKSPASFA